MTKLADHVEFTREDGKATMRIDGEEFPWYCTENGISWRFEKGGMPVIRIEIIANRVSIDDARP